MAEFVPDTVDQTSSNIPNSNDRSPANSRMQKYLNDIQSRAREIVKKIEEKRHSELSMDDLDEDTNAFTDLERLEKALVEAVNMLIKHKKHDAFPVPPPLSFSGSGYPKIDKAITKLIRPLGDTTREFQVPDRSSIEATIKSVNEKKNLGLMDKDIDGITTKIAVQMYTELIKPTEKQTFGQLMSQLVDIGEQPEASDAELAAKFAQNKTEQIPMSVAMAIFRENIGPGDIGQMYSPDDIGETGDGEECHESDITDEDTDEKENDEDDVLETSAADPDIDNGNGGAAAEGEDVAEIPIKPSSDTSIEKVEYEIAMKQTEDSSVDISDETNEDEDQKSNFDGNEITISSDDDDDVVDEPAKISGTDQNRSASISNASGSLKRRSTVIRDKEQKKKREEIETIDLTDD